MSFPLIVDGLPLGILCALFLASILYAAVGHGGASAYLAVMGFAGMAPPEMRPIALVLNIGVSLLALIAFARRGYFQQKIFGPLALVSMPAAFLGGWLQLPDPIFKMVLAAALLLGAWRLTFRPDSGGGRIRAPSLWALIALGLSIGLLSGLVGIGGGIFLTPLLILFRWSSSKCAAAISAAFIFVNSVAGISGFLVQGGVVPMIALAWLPVVLTGALLGAGWGSRRAQNLSLQRALAVVLVVAAAKFMVV